MNTPSLESTIQDIQSHSLFRKLQTIIENVPQIHDNENVFTHSLNTYKIAQDFINNPPLTDNKALRLFNSFINTDIDGHKRKDILQITALIHDCGKAIIFKEKGKKHSINSQRPQRDIGNTYCPGHEYLGAKYIVPELLKEKINNKAISYIQDLVRLHDTFNSYFPKDWNDDEILYDVKFRAEGFYIETLFNSYCDAYHATLFQEVNKSKLHLLNNPNLYTQRIYSYQT